MLWFRKKITDDNRKRRQSQKCQRCDFFYSNLLDLCPHCSDLCDSDLNKLLLQERKKNRGFGRLLTCFSLFVFAVIVLLKITNILG